MYNEILGPHGTLLHLYWCNCPFPYCLLTDLQMYCVPASGYCNMAFNSWFSRSLYIVDILIWSALSSPCWFHIHTMDPPSVTVIQFRSLQFNLSLVYRMFAALCPVYRYSLLVLSGVNFLRMMPSVFLVVAHSTALQLLGWKSLGCWGHTCIVKMC